MSTVTPEIVENLTRVDMATLLKASTAGDKSIIRMTDGKKPNEDELDLIMRATPDDIRAAADHVERHARLELERHRRRLRLKALVDKYARYPHETTESILTRMTPEDRDEFHELTGAFL